MAASLNGNNTSSSSNNDGSGDIARNGYAKSSLNSDFTSSSSKLSAGLLMHNEINGTNTSNNSSSSSSSSQASSNRDYNSSSSSTAASHSSNGVTNNNNSNNSNNNENQSNNQNNSDNLNSDNNRNNGGGGSGGDDDQIISSKFEFSNGQKDILRLIGQHLRYLGLEKTTETLIKESGCLLEHPIASNFCHLIMKGNWTEAEVALERLKSVMGQSNTDLKNMKFLILEQKYLEFLEDGKILEALKCLRDELAPLKFNTDRLHELSSFLMCTDQTNLKTLSKWSGKNELSRKYLMDKLQTFLPPNIMLPPRRLEALLTESIEYQCEKCSYHNFKEKFSIDNWCFLRNHECSKDDFPSVTLQILNDHCDEVWYCKFSNNGKKLATGSKDGCLIIWDVDPDTYKLTINKSYDEHTYGVSVVAWSPDDRYLIVCGSEECFELWIWDIENKVLKKKLSNSNDESLTSVAWLPDGQSFVVGGMKGHFYNCDLDGNIKETWEGVRVRALQSLPDGLVLAADSLKRIRLYNFKEINDSNLIQEDFSIVSFTLNKSATLVLICVAAQGVHLWDIKDKTLVRRFQGSIQNSYMNFSTFGGADEIYIASGSEDNKVYIWNIKKETPICVLEGHTRSVTCVTWNPEIPGMIVSASDDGTVRVWGPKSKLDSNLNPNSSNGATLESNLSNHDANLSSSNSDRTRLYGAERFLSRSENRQDQQSTSNNRSDRSTPV